MEQALIDEVEVVEQSSTKRKVGRPRKKPLAPFPKVGGDHLAELTKKGTPRKIASPKRPKRQRVDSAAGQINAMKNAALNITKPLRPPPQAKLRQQDEPFWEVIIATRSRDEWTPNDLVLAVHLSRCQADIESEQEILDIEGNVVETIKGPKPNPRAAIVETLVKREVTLARMLQMHAVGMGKRGAYVQQARMAEKKAHGTATEIQVENDTDDDADLLAGVDDDDD